MIVSAVLGHASPAFTLAVYQHVWQEGSSEAAHAIEQRSNLLLQALAIRWHRERNERSANDDLARKCRRNNPAVDSPSPGEASAARYCRKYELTRDDYDRAVNLVTELFELPSCKRMLTALSSALLNHGALTGEDAFRVLREAEADYRAGR